MYFLKSFLWNSGHFEREFIFLLFFYKSMFFFFSAQVHFEKSRKKKSYFEFMYVKWLKVKFSIGRL